MLRAIVLASVSVLACVAMVRADVVIETVTVGNPGNQSDIHEDGYGGVDYTYNIGMYEVAGQYTEFLNSCSGD